MTFPATETCHHDVTSDARARARSRCSRRCVRAPRSRSRWCCWRRRRRRARRWRRRLRTPRWTRVTTGCPSRISRDTRGAYAPDHALITPESRVYTSLFGWKETLAAWFITPPWRADPNSPCTRCARRRSSATPSFTRRDDTRPRPRRVAVRAFAHLPPDPGVPSPPLPSPRRR